MTHQPVLLNEVVERLVTNLNGAYVDGTVGSGGYLKRLATVVGSQARLYGIDVDPEAVERSRRNLSNSGRDVTIVHGSYHQITQLVDQFQDRQFDGVLLDLGLSSEQLDTAERGFAFGQDGPLDMRFNPKSGGTSAAELIHTSEESALAEIIRDFGEERQAKRIAGAIVRERQIRMIHTTAELSNIVAAVVPAHHLNKSLARVFQALRIAVNKELSGLSKALPDILDTINAGGRLLVVSYHSLEDRIVKRFMQEQEAGCICPPRQPVCTCRKKPRVKRNPRKAITPTPQEIEQNSRARSAKLRVAEVLDS